MIKRIFALLSEKQKRKSIWLVVSMFFRSILDFAGIAALVPIIFVIAEKLGNEKKLILLLCCGVVIVVLVKNAIILFLARFQTKFQLNIYKDFSRRLFVNHYKRGLMFMKKQSSVQLAYEVNGVSLIFSQNVLGSLYQIIGEGFLILFMISALIAWRPLMGLLTASLFLPIAIIYGGVVRKKIRKLGTEGIKAQRAQSRTVVEAFRGYAELEIANAFEASYNNFDRNLAAIVKNRHTMEIYQLFPFFLSEMAIVLGLIFLAIFGGNDLALTGGVFAIAAFRIIPAVRGIMYSNNALQNNASVIDVMEKGLKEPGMGDRNQLLTQPYKDNHDRCYPDAVITAHNLGFSFPDGEILFEGLTFKIKRGERVGIKGKSGSGKSTLFNLLLGFFPPVEGEICVEGKHLGPETIDAWHEKVGYVPQEIFIINGSLAENIALGQKNIDSKKVWKVLEQVSLGDWTRTLEDGLETNLGEFGSRLSGGQKQRIGIARALYKGAQVLFFDEATSALDYETETEINLTLKELSDNHQELTMIVIAHRESSLGFCDRILDMDQKKMIKNSLDES